MGSSQNFSVAVEMFGADIDDALSTQSERKSFLPLSRDKPLPIFESRGESSIMENELRSLQTKIIDLENKLSFSYLPEDPLAVGEPRRKEEKPPKSRGDSSDAERT